MEVLDSCLLCGYRGPFGFYMNCQDTLVSEEFFQIASCPQCNFLFTNPRPLITEISEYYRSANYISHKDAPSGIKEKLYHLVKRRMLKNKLRLLKKHTTREQRQILDFGCGTGDFVVAASHHGFAASGYEPDKHAGTLAKEKGVAVLNNAGELENLPSGSFDVVTMWHVLEHLHHPDQTLEMLEKLLTNDGLLFVAAPMANCADAEYYLASWAAYDVPRHLFHFTPRSLTRLAEKKGFSLIERKPLYYDAYYISLLSEQYLNQGKTSALTPFKAFYRGSQSNIKARITKRPASSEIFVFKKK